MKRNRHLGQWVEEPSVQEISARRRYGDQRRLQVTNIILATI